jgi:hypothetical protein
MSQLLCPLCGRLVSLKYFDPSGFDDDIYVVEVKGLGRGKGVKVVGKYSILGEDDETVRLIGERSLTLLKLLIEHGHLKPDGVTSRLDLQGLEVRDKLIEDLTKQVVGLKEELDRYKHMYYERRELIEKLIEENVKLKSQISKLEEKLNKMRNEIRKLKGIIKRLKLKGAIERSLLRDLTEQLIEG